jgi:hypothetical protein
MKATCSATPLALRITCWLFFVGMVTAPCCGDLLLEFKNRVESLDRHTAKEFISDSRTQIWLGKDVARWNLEKGVSYILDLSQDVFFIVYHSKKTYQTFQAPIILEKLLADEASRAYEEVKRILAPTVTAEGQGQPLFIGKWQTNPYHWSMNTAVANEVSVKAWVSEGLGVDEDLYDALLLNRNTLNIVTTQWFPHVVALEGVVVKYELVTDSGRLRRKETDTLVAIAEHPFEAARYLIPEGYEEIAFDSKDVFVIDRLQAEKPRVRYAD